MLHSGLSKSHPFPLLAAASSPRRTLLAGLLRAGYLSKHPASSPVPRPTTTARASARAATSPGDPSRFGLGGRVSFSTAPDGTATAGCGRTLPWLAAEAGNSGAPAARTSASRSSSWESSMEKFFSRDDQYTRREVTGDRMPNRVAITEEDGENEPIDNPKWGRIKDRCRRVVGRDGRARGGGERFRRERFDRPDVRQWNNQENWGRKTGKEAGESTVPKMMGQGVYGVGPVLAALMAGRREFYALYMQESMDLSGSNKKKKDKKAVEKVLRMAERIGLKVIEVSKHDLNMVVDNRPHQGLLLDASPLEMVNTKELDPVRVEGGKAPVWIALDEVMDPQNLGAIIRSAYYFGAEGVVLCAKNSAPLSGVVSKASAGSLELIELLSCRNMMQFLSSSAENGWRVLGGTIANKAVPLSEVETGAPTILVLGSEGTGLRPLVERSCTDLVRIPGNADVFVEGADADTDAGEEGDSSSSNQDLRSFLAVESLNVSVAAGVLLYHLAGKDACPVSVKPSLAQM
ncbi:rRNA methyltransferase 1, mitochondrial [Dichanthelium oligosanthes]|uniref:rRNA methyltransferase 1, mitochondrial n=1 Tax=Dichanthelium oligosanthes TaxID=888268 RepID=A0A1E5V4M9_9POAL|nr:rRNA methyltransferase 1, mitochondrial [Dichanthelium oligosanthes]